MPSTAAQESGQPTRPRRRPSKARRQKAVTEVGAGGIVFKRTPQGVRLALIRDPYGRWAFPKGHQEPGESIEATALRETREELGLGRLEIVKPLGKIDFWFRDRYREESKGELIHKYVHYFLMEAPARAKGQPQKKEKISRLTWVVPSRAARLSGYKDMKNILRLAIRELGRLPPRAPGSRSGQPKRPLSGSRPAGPSGRTPKSTKKS